MAAKAARSFRAFPHLLPVVHQHGALAGGIHERHDGRQNSAPRPAPCYRRADTLFIVVFHITDAVGQILGLTPEEAVKIVGPVPPRIDMFRQMVAIGVIDGIESGFQQGGTGIARSGFQMVIVGFRHEKHVGQTHPGAGNGPFPERHGNHLGHVAPEPANAQSLPE